MVDYKFLRFCAVALGTMFLGSHVVFSYYQPMADFDDYVRKEAERRKQAKAEKKWIEHFSICGSLSYYTEILIFIIYSIICVKFDSCV